MKYWNSIIFIYLIFILIIVSLFISKNFEENTKLNLNLDLDGFELLEKTMIRESERYIFSNTDEQLIIKKVWGIKEESANSMINNEILSIKAIYANMFSPYPGEVSQEIVCDEKYKPSFSEKEDYVTLFTGERQGLGACSEDVIIYKTLIGWIFCNTTNELYNVKYYIPLNKSTKKLGNFFSAISCR